MPHTDLYFVGDWPCGPTWRPPSDCPVEQEAMMGRGQGRYCEASPPGSAFICTRPRGHAGDHVAANYETVVARWRRE